MYVVLCKPIVAKGDEGRDRPLKPVPAFGTREEDSAEEQSALGIENSCGVGQ